jgi:hypothetical protein
MRNAGCPDRSKSGYHDWVTRAMGMNKQPEKEEKNKN